jgi:hypothetical protein
MFWSTKTTSTATSANAAAPSGSYYVSTNGTPTWTTINIGAGGGGTMSGTNSVITSGVYAASITQPTMMNAAGTVSITGMVKIEGDEPTIKTNKNKINLDQLAENIRLINEMFHLIVPDWRLLEKHPTLMDAFQQYDAAKHIEPKYKSKEYVAAYHQFKLLEAFLENSNEE